MDKSKTYCVNVFGDFCTSNHVGQFNRKAFDNMEPYIQAADINVINLEGAIAGNSESIRKTGPNLKIKNTDLDLLKTFSPLVLTLANNHVGDFGEKGVENTIKVLDDMDFYHVGAGENIEKAYERVYFSSISITICVLSVCENEFGVAGKNKAGVAGYDEKRISEIVMEESNKGNTVLIVVHGGNEYNPLPSTYTQRRYRHLIDMGASAIVGMHSHCMQGYEVYKNKPIIYGVGNFYFFNKKWLDKYSGWNNGYSVRIKFTTDNCSFDFTPFRYNPEEDLLESYTNEELKEFNEYLGELNRIILDPDLLEKYYKAWCMLKGPFAELLLKLDLYDEQTSELYEVLNRFRCESHRELLCTYYELRCNGEEKESISFFPNLKQIMDMHSYLGISEDARDKIDCKGELEKLFAEEDHILLYGAGKISEGIILSLPKKLRDRIDGILVSSLADNPKYLMGIKVHEFGTLDHNARIIVSVGHDKREQIINTLIQRGLEKYSVLSDSFEDYINLFLYYVDRVKANELE